MLSLDCGTCFETEKMQSWSKIISLGLDLGIGPCSLGLGLGPGSLYNYTCIIKCKYMFCKRLGVACVQVSI